MASVPPTAAPTIPGASAAPSIVYVQQPAGSSKFGGPMIKVVLIAGVGMAVYYWWANSTLGQFSGWNLMTKFLNPQAWKTNMNIAQESGKQCGKKAKGIGIATCGVSSFFSSGLGGLIKTK